MRKCSLMVLAFAFAAVLWGADWASRSGNPQRDGWAQDENELVKSSLPDLRLLYKRKLDNQARGLDSLTSPIILGNSITYKGFKEMLFVGGSSDTIYSIDAALNRLLWKTHFDYKADRPQGSPTAVCPGGLTATPAILGGSGAMRPSFNYFRRHPKPTPGGVFSTGFGRNGYVFAIGSDGYLRFVRQSDGNDAAIPPVKFLPPNAKVSSINVIGTVVYAATVDGCGGNPNALYAIDLGGPERNVVSILTNGSGLAGVGGTAIGAQGTVYAQVETGHGDVAGKYEDTVLALDPYNLKVKDYFTPSGAAPRSPNGAAHVGITPTVFAWKGKDLVVAGGSDGALYLLDSTSLGGPGHHTPLCRTEPIAAASAHGATGIVGDFATWEDEATNTRWIYAALRGPVSADAKFPMANGAAASGSIVACKVKEKNGKPTLVLEWISRDLITPASPITTNGLVFALSTGLSNPAEREKPDAHATLYILDGATGKELFSSGNAAQTFSHGSGLALANGRVYFTTHDNTVSCYGLPAMQPQLTER